MKKITVRLLTILSIGSFIVSCSSDPILDNPIAENETEVSTGGQILNKEGSVDGVHYCFSNVSLNPDLLILNNDNATLTSSEQDLNNGIIKLHSVSNQIADKLVVGTVFYISIDAYTAIKKIDSVVRYEDGTFELHTTQSQLGEMFDQGEIDLFVDLFEVSKELYAKTPIVRTEPYGGGYYNEILNVKGKYTQWGFEYDPATNVSMYFDFKMSFNKKQILPSRVSTIFELKTEINPFFQFAGSYNRTVNDDLIKFIPESMLELIRGREFEINIPLKTLGIEEIPAKISIKDINMPTSIEANLSKESSLGYGVNGSLKIGSIVDIDHLRATRTPVYENSLQVHLPSTLDLHGELLTSAEIVIMPDVSIVNNSYNVSGDIRLGVKTESNGNVKLPGKSPVFGSKGTFFAKANLELDLLLIKVPIELLNQEKVLWDVGSFDRTVTYSDLKWNVTSSYTTNVLASTRSYATNFTVDYKYPILGKMLAKDMFISYQVYQKNGTTRIESVNKKSLAVQNVTGTNFLFVLNIPYKKTSVFSSTYETESYLKNIIISDNNGYVYEGIFNTTVNKVENSFLIKR